MSGLKPWVVLLSLLASAACQPLGSYPIDSPFYQPPAGGQLALNQAIEIPPDRATLRFQFGKPVQSVHEYDTHCIFEVTTLSEAPQRIQPDLFQITKVRSGSSIYSVQRSLPGPIPARWVFDDDSGPTHYYFRTEMFLHSARQPQVLLLTCQHVWVVGTNWSRERPPTLAEMQQALGSYFTFKLPGI